MLDSGDYIELFFASEQTHHTLVLRVSEWATVALRYYNVHFFSYPQKWCTHMAYIVVTWLVPLETAVILEHVLLTPYNHAPVYSVTLSKATYIGYTACLAVTCQLHFWQNDQDILHAIGLTRGWNGY